MVIYMFVDLDHQTDNENPDKVSQTQTKAAKLRQIQPNSDKFGHTRLTW